MARLPWVRLPSAWIDAGGLQELRWKGAAGSDNTAALMTLMAIAHHADRDTGLAKVTYDTLCMAAGLSRSKLANGIAVLEGIGVIAREPVGRSSYQLVGFDRSRDWAMLPVKALYNAQGQIAAFTDFTLRNAAELNALKLYFLFVARRGRDTNMANISFDKIVEYSGVERHRIKAATSLLASLQLAYVERLPSGTNDFGVANAYRLVGLESYNHMGTRGRGLDTGAFGTGE